MTVKSDACELGNRRVLVKEPDEDENSDVDIFVEVGIWIPVCIEDKNSLCWPDGAAIPVSILNDVSSPIVDFLSWDLSSVNASLWKLEDLEETDREEGPDLMVLVTVDDDMCFIGPESDLVANLLDDEKSGIVSDMLLVLTTLLVVFWGCDCTEEVRVVIVLDEIAGLVLEVTTRRVLRDSGGTDSDFLISMSCWEAETRGKNSDLLGFNLSFGLWKLFWDSIFSFPSSVVPKVDVFASSREYVFWTTVLVYVLSLLVTVDDLVSSGISFSLSSDRALFRASARSITSLNLFNIC